MSRKSARDRWVPEIVYDESGSQIPYIHVPEGEEDPGILFIFLSRQTGETEPGDDGEEVPIVDMDLHQYVDMETLKRGLPAPAYDQVRSVLGLLPLKEAAAKGREITSNVRGEIGSRTDVDKRRDEIYSEVAESLRKKSTGGA
jgi:hypothetical protein